jgi:hypothetical protein
MKKIRWKFCFSLQIGMVIQTHSFVALGPRLREDDVNYLSRYPSRTSLYSRAVVSNATIKKLFRTAARLRQNDVAEGFFDPLLHEDDVNYLSIKPAIPIHMNESLNTVLALEPR